MSLSLSVDAQRQGDAEPWCPLDARPVRVDGTDGIRIRPSWNRVVVQTREVSPLKRAAVSSLHAGQWSFFHTRPTIHRFAAEPGFGPRPRAELDTCARWRR